MVRSVGAVGTFVLGLHKKREKVPHPGLQHVDQEDLSLLYDMTQLPAVLPVPSVGSVGNFADNKTGGVGSVFTQCNNYRFGNYPLHLNACYV